LIHFYKSFRENEESSLKPVLTFHFSTSVLKRKKTPRVPINVLTEFKLKIE